MLNINKIGLNEEQLEKYDKQIKKIAKQVISKFSDKEKKELLENSDYTKYHFTLGLYIRNNYIYNKIKVFMPDEMSEEIFNKIIKLLLFEKINKNKQK